MFVVSTPVGWVVGTTAAGAALGYGLCRLVRSGGRHDRIREELRGKIRDHSLPTAEHWFRDVYDAGAGLLPVHKKRIEEALNQAKKNKVVRFDRTYDGELGSWIDAALAENARQPFHAIIAQANPGGDGAVLCVNDIDENDGRMAVAPECAVARDVNALVTALKEFLRFGSRIVFVDPFFDPYNQGYKDIFFKFLSVVKELNPDAVCEVHYRYHANKPCNADLEKEGSNLFKKIIPDGTALTVLCWKERPGGEDFHARYLLTDKGGARVDAGFDPVGHQHHPKGQAGRIRTFACGGALAQGFRGK